jgi:hypothetical protein
MKPLYLIACSNAKLDHAAPAAELYQGQAFRLAMAAAERAGADVIILSALHGAVFPNLLIAPYDLQLSAMAADDRRQWAANVRHALSEYHGRAITVLAGKHYAAAVESWPNVSRPLAGLGIGQQLAALKNLNTTVQELEALEELALADYRAEEADRRALNALLSAQHADAGIARAEACQAIRAGQLTADTPGLLAAFEAMAARRVRIEQPNYRSLDKVLTEAEV